MIPSALSVEAAQSFRRIYEKEFGESLSDGEAQITGMQLLRFFAILTKQTGGPAKPSTRV